MPKLKTNKSAAKRFRCTASGHLKHRHAYKNHILTKKNSKRKSGLSEVALVDKSDAKAVKRMLNIL